MITQRQQLRERFGIVGLFNPSKVAVTTLDEQFLTNVKQTIEQNLDDETFSVIELGKAVGLNRSQLHRKLKALTDHSPNQIIQDMRLMRAKELLETGVGTVSEVAFMAGFSSFAYFSKCFSDRFGQSPHLMLKEKITSKD